MVNKVILIGNLGQDPETPKTTQSGMSVLDISIATKRRSKNEDITDWHTVTCWNKTAETVHKYLKKGRQVYIEGRLQYDTWTDESSGKNRKKAKIVADSVQFLGSKNDEVSGGSSNRNQNNTESNMGPIPF
jgi:single-strand DNA-binding protein|tara:strand:- start:455 stop:847 length:393 start_codon:yes stop_codon:yes gene_type:complete